MILSLSLFVCGEQIAIVYAYYGIANLHKLSARAHISAACYFRIERANNNPRYIASAMDRIEQLDRVLYPGTLYRSVLFEITEEDLSNTDALSILMLPYLIANAILCARGMRCIS